MGYRLPTVGLRIRVRGLRKRLPESASRILDADCGRGVITRYLSRQYPDATVDAVDADPDAQLSGRKFAGKSGFDSCNCVEAGLNMGETEQHEMIGETAFMLRRLRQSPHLLVPAVFAWLRGWWYRIKFALQFKRFRAGRFFRVYGPLVISGPGRVRFGDNCLIISNAIKPVCIRTLSRDASVTLGDNAGLNGTSIQSVGRVAIGDLSNIADAYITDTAAHSIGRSRRMESVAEAKSEPVRIGRNVWVSVQTVILSGVTVGDDSVIGACTLVREDVPEGVLVAGNPMKVIKSVDS